MKLPSELQRLADQFQRHGSDSIDQALAKEPGEPQPPDPIPRPTGEDRFNAMTAEEQDAQFGAETAQKLRDGDITLADLVRRTSPGDTPGFIVSKPQYSFKKYDPHQPRDPGGEHGGQWVAAGGNGVSLTEARKWANSAPKGGWGGIVTHGTSPEAAAQIRRNGFSLDHSAPDGEFGPGIYFGGGKLADFTDVFGSDVVRAAVRLKNPARPEDINEVRSQIRIEMAGSEMAYLRGTNRDPKEFKRRFFKRLHELGYDGTISDKDGSVVAVYDVSAIKVIEDRTNL